MYDVEVGERLFRTCNYRSPTVLCPLKDRVAKITAAKWQVRNDGWTKWVVIDCPLLPAGKVWCDQSCLLLLDEPRL